MCNKYIIRVAMILSIAFIGSLTGQAAEEQLVNAVVLNDVAEFKRLVANNPQLVTQHLKDYGLQTPLHLAAEYFNRPMAEFLLAHGADVNALDEKGKTSLQVIAKHSHADLPLVEFLIEQGADVKAKDKEGKTPLHWAEGCDVIKLLVNKGANINEGDKIGRTPLHDAVRRSNAAYNNIKPALAVVECFVEQGADVNAANKNGVTALHFADEPDVIEFLLAQGADVNSRDKQDQTPLHNAVRIGRGDPEVVSALLEAGADVNAKDKDERTPLHRANNSVASLLIGYGADYMAKDKEGRVPLHRAAWNRYLLEVVKLLVEKHRVNANIRDDEGKAPLHYAGMAGYPRDVVDLLVRNGAFVRARDNKGFTPLHYAAGALYSGDIPALLEHGAKIDARTPEGFTPLHIATMTKYGWDHIGELVNHGADSNVTDTAGRTPLHIAAKLGNLEAVRRLIDYVRANVDQKDDSGKTALDYAKAGKKKTHTEIIEYLEKGEAGLTITPGVVISDESKAALAELLDDFKQYKTTNLKHAGDVYEHSVWTAHALANWFAENSFWVRDIDKKDQDLTILAGLLHDVGKVGDLKFDYRTKPDHPEVGFQYLLGERGYYLSTGMQYSFWPLGQELLKLSKRDAALLAIVAGMHWAFGGTAMKCQNPRKYVKELVDYAARTRYGKPDLRLLKICLAVSAADTHATKPVRLEAGVENPFGIPDVPAPAGRQIPKETLYEMYEYGTVGEGCYQAIIDEFLKQFSH